MNRCASQRRAPERGSATRSKTGSWKAPPGCCFRFWASSNVEVEIGWGEQPERANSEQTGKRRGSMPKTLEPAPAFAPLWQDVFLMYGECNPPVTFVGRRRITSG